MPQDHTLLHQYTAHTAVTGTVCDSPGRQALDQLIRRHLDLVYSSALRQVRDPHLAEDITQAVFLILAQRAKSIRDGIAVGGWLLAVTRTTAVDAMRKRTQDQRHEQALAKPERRPDDSAQSADWDQLSPVLDAALTRLSPSDRDALILRFFENRSLSQVGAALGISEDTATKRVSRALTRLRTILKSRGILTPTAVLTASLSTNAIHAAPVHLLPAILAGTPAPSIVSLAKGALRAMARATAKLVAATALAFLLLTILSAVAFSHAFGPPAPVATLIPVPPANFPPAARFTAPESALPSFFTTDDWYAGSNFDAAQPGTAADPVASPIQTRSGTTYPYAIAADGERNIYAIGETWDATGKRHGIVRQKRNGQLNWETILNLPYLFSNLLVTASGDVYVTAMGPGWHLLHKSPGQEQFLDTLIGDVMPPTTAGNGGIGVDDSGNIFVSGAIDEHWIVRKLAYGSGDFVTVDDFVADDTLPPRWYHPWNNAKPYPNIAFALTIVGGSGLSAGIYVVGHCTEPAGTDSTGAPTFKSHWFVRRSKDAGNTWVTVDDYVLHDAPTSNMGMAYRVCADLAGNVFVTGQGDEQISPTTAPTDPAQSPTIRAIHWTTRRSATGDAGTWKVDDDYALSTALPYSNVGAVAADSAGHVYVAGVSADDTGKACHAIIRTNAGGYWHTIDDFNPLPNRACWTALAIDRGTLYAAGWVQGPNPGWIVRSVALATLETPHSVPTTTALLKH